MFYDPSKSRLYILSRILLDPKNPSPDPSQRGPGIVDVIQQQDADHYQKIATYVTGFAAQTGLFVPELGKLFVATVHQAPGQSAEILVYDTK
jgi:hypothetical protein